jgi:CelD/BcsL family acetyltransferase involved in cellulose biosynthesis
VTVPSVRPNETRLEVLDSPECLEAVETEWRSLWQSDPNATPFQSPEWLIPWIRHLWGGGKLRILMVRERGRLIALAPFFLWGFGNDPQIIRLSFLGAGISDYLDIVCDPKRAELAARAVWRWIAESKEWDICDLRELRATSPIVRCPTAELPVARSQCSVCPVLPLPPTFEGLLAALPPKFRRSLRTAGNRLRGSGAVTFRRVDGQDCREAMERLFELHTGRWEERGGSGMFTTSALRAFHCEAAQRFARSGMLRLYQLAVDGQCIAVQYNFAAKSRVYAYQAGFDPLWSRASPGAQVLAHSIADAISEGMGVCDFLRHSEDFKYAWGARDARTERIAIEH